MNEDKRSRKGRALALVIASLVVVSPVIGCSESHPLVTDAGAVENDAAPLDDASFALPDAFVATDAGRAPDDAAIALADDAAAEDAAAEDAAWDVDADMPDAYPAYVRG